MEQRITVMSATSIIKKLLSKRFKERLKAALGIHPEIVHTTDLSDLSADDLAKLRAVDGFTMTSIERRFALIEAVRHLHRAGVPGALVECGVWRGGSAMLMASQSLALGQMRDIYLYDTFEGMPPPDAVDVDFTGVAASARMEATRTDADNSAMWCRAQLDEVKANLRTTGYPDAFLHYVVGKVEDTIPSVAPETIALLRLDTDWYSSTKHELEHLYPRLQSGGVLIIDDYGYWKGARQAVDEYFAGRKDAPLLVRVDQTCRAAVKP